MKERTTGIKWTHHTFNPWWGCEKISPGCAQCYAETFSFRTGHANLWGGPKSERRFFGYKHWQEPIEWNRAAQNTRLLDGKKVIHWRANRGVYMAETPIQSMRKEEGILTRMDADSFLALPRPRTFVFSASMADILEDRDDTIPAFIQLMETIHATQELTWQLLTKRPDMFPVRLEKAYRHANKIGMMIAGYILSLWSNGEIPENVWFGTTAENQEELDRRLPHLGRIPAAKRFLSVEPMLGPVVLPDSAPVDWVICGGESGKNCRHIPIDLGLKLAAQCESLQIPFFWKQDSGPLPGQQGRIPSEYWENQQFPA